MSNTCDFCDEEIDGDDTYHYVKSCKFVQTSHGSVRLDNMKVGDACEECHSCNTFYCCITDENYSYDHFSSAEDSDGDYVCVEAVTAAGYIQDQNDQYILPKEPLSKDKTVSDTKYVDFYWQLRDGERHGVLQLDGGNEENMPASLERAIYNRIEEAGANKGDPSVVNVYTRLELIDRSLLPADYTL